MRHGRSGDAVLARPPEFDEVSFEVGEEGAMLSLQASGSPDATIELEWLMTIENLREQPCAVAVYAWVGDVDFPSLALDRPNADSPEDWPAIWEGGELVAAGLVEGMDGWTSNDAQVDEPSSFIFARYVIATCPGAAMRVEMRADAVVEYGPWRRDRGMYVQLTRMD
jgi:hypothetical protein